MELIDDQKLKIESENSSPEILTLGIEENGDLKSRLKPENGSVEEKSWKKASLLILLMKLGMFYLLILVMQI